MLYTWSVKFSVQCRSALIQRGTAYGLVIVEDFWRLSISCITAKLHPADLSKTRQSKRHATYGTFKSVSKPAVCVQLLLQLQQRSSPSLACNASSLSMTLRSYRYSVIYRQDMRWEHSQRSSCAFKMRMRSLLRDAAVSERRTASIATHKTGYRRVDTAQFTLLQLLDWIK